MRLAAHGFSLAVSGLESKAMTGWSRLTAYWKQDTGIASADGCNTLVESIPEGWFYTAGLAENRRVTGFMTDRDLLPGKSA